MTIFSARTMNYTNGKTLSIARIIRIQQNEDEQLARTSKLEGGSRRWARVAMTALRFVRN
jgi:hypothetical protein